MNVGNKLLKVALEAIDLEKLGAGILDEVVEEALNEVVKSTATPIDDGIKAALWPLLEKALKDVLAKKVKELKDHQQAP